MPQQTKTRIKTKTKTKPNRTPRLNTRTAAAAAVTVQERIVQKRNFPTDCNHDGVKEPRTVYVGAQSNRFYSKRDWQAQFSPPRRRNKPR